MPAKNYAELPRNEQLAWAAGIIDGEGHIRSSITENRPDHFVRRFSVSVPQTNPVMLERLVMVGGGSIRMRKPPKNPKHSQRWDYSVTGVKGIRFIKEIWPWLGPVKRAQAESAIAEWESLVTHHTEEWEESHGY